MKVNSFKATLRKRYVLGQLQRAKDLKQRLSNLSGQGFRATMTSGTVEKHADDKISSG